MCVIIIKPRGVEMPSNNILKAAYKANRDGCGLVTESGYYRTLDFDKFTEQLIKVKTEENAIIHFRLATHGSVKVENCHPFKGNGIYFAHNGILDIRPHKDKTDSETAFRKIILPAAEKHGFCSQFFDQVCNDILGYSRFAFMYDGQIKTFGEYQEIDGVLYSNLRFMSYYLRQSDNCHNIKTNKFT